MPCYPPWWRNAMCCPHCIKHHDANLLCAAIALLAVNSAQSPPRPTCERDAMLVCKLHRLQNDVLLQLPLVQHSLPVAADQQALQVNLCGGGRQGSQLPLAVKWQAGGAPAQSSSAPRLCCRPLHPTATAGPYLGQG